MGRRTLPLRPETRSGRAHLVLLPILAVALCAGFALWISEGGSPASPGRTVAPRAEEAGPPGASATQPRGEDEHALAALPAGSVRVSGSVLNRADRSPLAGASVRLWPSENLGAEPGALPAGESTTEPDGSYALALPGAALTERSVLHFELRGYVPVSISGDIVLESPSLEPVVLKPGNLVRGKVVDSSGRAVGCGVVFALLALSEESATDPESGEDTIYYEGTATAATPVGSDGSFEVAVTGDRFALQSRVPGYAPGWVGPFASGEVRDASIEVLVEPGHAFRGRVVDSAGRPIAGARIEVSPTILPHEPDCWFAWYLGAWSAASAPDGTFAVVDLPAAIEDFTISHDDYFPYESETEQGPTARPVEDYVLLEGQYLTGRIEVSGGLAAVPTDILLRDRGRTLGSAVVTPDGSLLSGRLPLASGSAVLDAAGMIPVRVEWTPSPGAHDLGAIVLEPGCAVAVVVSDSSGRPIRDARVRLSPTRVAPSARSQSRAELGARTDENGRADIRGLSPGLYRAVAEEPYHLPAEQPVELSLAERDTKLELVLGAGASITLVVQDPNGAPLSGVRARVRERRAAADGTTSYAEMSLPGWTSDAGGALALNLVSPGVALRLSLMHEKYPAYVVPLEPLAAGEKRSLQAVTLAAGTAIRGTVHDGDGRPIAAASVTGSASVSLEDEEWAESFNERTDDAGRFETKGLREGRYELLCHAAGYLGPAHRTVDLTAGAALEIGFVLDAGLTYEGIVVTEDGEAAGGVAVHVTVTLDAGGTRAEQSAQADEAGEFRVGGLPDGEVVVHVSVQGRDSDLLPAELRAPTLAVLPREIVLAHGATIELVIEAPEAHRLPEYAAVTLARGSDTAERASRGTGAGQYAIEGAVVRIQGVEAGDYRLGVLVEGFRPLESLEVSATNGRTTRVPIALGDPGRMLTVVVVRPSRDPIPGAHVRCDFAELLPAEPDASSPGALVEVHRAAMSRSGISDEHGEWRFRIPDGFVAEFAVEAIGFAAARLERVDSASAGERFEVVLEPAAKLVVLVRDRNGRADESVRIALESLAATPAGDPQRGPVPTYRHSSLASEVEFESLAAGRYMLRVHRASTELHATVVELEAGEAKTLELAVDPGIEVHGVVSINGEAVDQGYLSFDSEQGDASAQVGRSGAYRVTLAAPGDCTVTYRGSENIEVFDGPFAVPGSRKLDLDFRAVRFDGAVLLPDGTPACGVSCMLLSSGGLGSVHARTDSAGRLALEAVTPGHYWWTADPPEGLRVTRVEVVLLQDAAGTLTLERPSTLRVTFPESASAGGVHFVMLRPGSEPKDAPITNPVRGAREPVLVSWSDGIRYGYASTGSSAAIFETPPGTTDIELALEPCGTMLARFEDVDSSPRQPLEIVVEWLGADSPFWITTAYGPSPAPAVLPPGNYQARLRAGSASRPATHFTIASGQTTEIDLE